MTKQNQKPKVVSVQSNPSGINLPVIGGIIGVAALVIVSFFLYSLFSQNNGSGTNLTIGEREGTAQAEGTKVADESKTSLANYCKDHPERCISTGNSSSKVKVYEFSDYGCPACKVYNTDTEPRVASEYIDPGVVEYIVIPSAVLNNAAGVASTPRSPEAVLCANELGKGNEYHVAIFTIQENHKDPSDEKLIQLAKDTGIDEKAFSDCLTGNRYREAAGKNRAFSLDTMKVNSTPSFFVNGEKVRGIDFNGLSSAITKALNQD